MSTVPEHREQQDFGTEYHRFYEQNGKPLEFMAEAYAAIPQACKCGRRPP